jgi:hypothetical protein
METSTFISVLSLLLSVGACVFSERSASSAESSAASAERANHIAQHKDRLEIYKAVQKFHMEVLIKGSRFPDTVIWPFADAANLSEFYYPRTLYTELQAIYELALKTVNMSENEQSDRAAGERPSANDKAVRLRKMHEELRTRLKASDDSLRAQLRQEPLELNGSPA